MEIISSDDEGATLVLSRSELRLIRDAIFEVCYDGTLPVEEWEFPTRMGGMERVEALILAEKVRDLLRGRDIANPS